MIQKARPLCGNHTGDGLLILWVAFYMWKLRRPPLRGNLHTVFHRMSRT